MKIINAIAIATTLRRLRLRRGRCTVAARQPDDRNRRPRRQGLEGGQEFRCVEHLASGPSPRTRSSRAPTTRWAPCGCFTLKDGGTIKEKLLAFSTPAPTFRYAIVEGVIAGERLHLDLDRQLRRQGQGDGDLVRPLSSARTRAPAPATTRTTRPRPTPSRASIKAGLSNLKKMLEGQ